MVAVTAGAGDDAMDGSNTVPWRGQVLSCFAEAEEEVLVVSSILIVYPHRQRP